MKISFYFLFASIATFLLSCNKGGGSSKDLSGVKINYIKEFPHTYHLKEYTKPNVAEGIEDFRVYDSLMIISKRSDDKLWSFYALPSYHHLGDFLDKGRGPFEFSQGADLFNIYRKKGELHSYTFDSNAKRVFDFNISKSLQTGELHMSKFIDSLPVNTWGHNTIVFDSSKVFLKLMENGSQLNRYLLKDGVKTTNPFLEKWNRESVRKGEDYNILSSLTRYHEKRDLFVESQAMMNYLSIHSLDGSVAKVVCVGDKLDTPQKVQRKFRWSRIAHFGGLRVYDDFFATVHINVKDMVDPADEDQLGSILLFDWEGEPLAKIILDDFNIFAFDIDFNEGVLYALDVYHGLFHKYNIQSILDELRRR